MYVQNVGVKEMFRALKKVFKQEEDKREVIGAPIVGKVVAITEVSDPTFGQEILGKGVAIIPSEGKVVAPVDGRIEMMFDTKHAITMKSKMGTEILIHIGLDTVTLKGEPFHAYVEAGQHVRAGDLLLEFDINVIKDAGLDIISPIVICNTEEYSDIISYTDKTVKVLEEVLAIIK